MTSKDNIFFTSDTHYFHRNIIKYCNRPWDDTEAMTEGLIERYNSKVRPDSDVYILGDFAFCGPERSRAILERLNGRKHLVRGNHDGYKFIRKNGDMFEWVKDYHELSVDDRNEKGKSYKQLIILCHYAFKVWHKSHHGSWNLFGHSHGSMPDDPNALQIDVGVDCHDWYPLSYDEVKAIMKTKTWKPVDHHDKDTNP